MIHPWIELYAKLNTMIFHFEDEFRKNTNSNLDVSGDEQQYC